MPESRTSRAKRGILFVFAMASVAALLYEHVALVRSQEALARDAQTRLRAMVLGPRSHADVIVVQINDLEYDTLFGGRSPLDPGVLQQVIAAILKGDPATLGIDLDTSHPSFRSLAPSFVAGAPVVWARAADWLCSCDDGDARCRVPVLVSFSGDTVRRFRHCGDREPGDLVPLPILGGTGPLPSGVAALANDEDGLIRREQRSFRTRLGILPSFAWAVARAADPKLRRASGEPDDEFYIDYRPMRGDAKFSVDEVLGFAKNSGYDVFRDKVILLGGAYGAARDRYPTPLGVLHGVDIHAQIIETELKRKTVRPLNGFWLLFVSVAGSIGLLVLFQRFPFTQAFRRACLLWIPFVATAGSWIATGSPLALWPYLVPILGCVLIHQMREVVLDAGTEVFQPPSTRSVRDGV